MKNTKQKNTLTIINKKASQKRGKGYIYMKLERYDFTTNGYDFGSMPRVANSFRIMRLIQAEMFPSPSCSTAFSIAERKAGSNLNWKGGLPTLFLSNCIDISTTPILLFKCTDILNTIFRKSKRPLMRPTSIGVLITTLKEVKIMTKSHYIGSLCLKKATSQE